MKTAHHFRTPLLLLALTGIASAQLKVGSNPESISATANFETESTNGTKTVIDKTTGNLGIGTTTPASALTVNGGIATNYTSLTANAYTLLATDSIVAWSGTAEGTLTLPAAVSGTGNFKGRTYTVKNTSGSYSVTVTASGSEKIDANSSYPISPGASATFVSTGATSGATWTAVRQSSTAATTFSGNYVSGVDLSGLPVATINVNLTTNVQAEVGTSEMTTAMNTLPASGGVIVIKLNGTVSHNTTTMGTNQFIKTYTPTNVAGRTFYLLYDYSNANITTSNNSGLQFQFTTTSPVYLNTYNMSLGSNVSIFSTNALTSPIKSSPIFAFHGTSSDYWICSYVGGVVF